MEMRRKSHQTFLMPRGEHLALSHVQAMKECAIHKGEPIKYFCRTDSQALCPECIVNHARHDFIFAENDAAEQVKH